jgi:PHD/YefM family antitoxin component YafN of YafNO toxin-antitoxin module
MTNLGVRERRRLAALYKQARSAPVFCERHGKPRLVVLAVEEYARLKLRVDDPLGYDTSDPNYIRQMTEDALSGKNRIYVEAELAVVRRLFRKSKPGEGAR